MAALVAVTLDECSELCHVQMSCQPPTTAQCQLDVKHDTNLFVNAPPVIYLFPFLHIGTAFMVIVLFHGHLVRQYRACVVDSLGLGITHVHVSYISVCARHPNLVSFIFYILIVEFTCLLSF